MCYTFIKRTRNLSRLFTFFLRSRLAEDPAPPSSSTTLRFSDTERIACIHSSLSGPDSTQNMRSTIVVHCRPRITNVLGLGFSCFISWHSVENERMFNWNILQTCKMYDRKLWKAVGKFFATYNLNQHNASLSPPTQSLKNWCIKWLPSYYMKHNHTALLKYFWPIIRLDDLGIYLHIGWPDKWRGNKMARQTKSLHMSFWAGCR